MSKEIRIDLINNNGEKDTYTQTLLPVQKLIDGLELQEQFETDQIKTESEGVLKKVEFVASCFDDKRVTTESILNGLDVRDFVDKIDGIINIVMGADPEVKKQQTETP